VIVQAAYLTDSESWVNRFFCAQDLIMNSMFSSTFPLDFCQVLGNTFERDSLFDYKS